MQLQKKAATAVPALADALVDFGYVSTVVFQPSRGRQVGISRNGLELMMARGDFPRPVRLGQGPKAPIRWRLSELQSWLASRTAAA